MSDEIQPPSYVIELAKRLVERCYALNLKGKKRDDECLSYWLGAAQGAMLAGNAQMGQHLHTGAMIIAVRGHFEVAVLANKTRPAPPTPLTAEQALRAIRARINGVWDDPDLQKLGPLSEYASEDVLGILNRTAMK